MGKVRCFTHTGSSEALCTCAGASPCCCQPAVDLDHIREENFVGEEQLVASWCIFLVRPGRVTVKSWLLLGMSWEGQGLRQLGRNLRPCFFPVQPFLVDQAVRESHECLASALRCVFPAFVIELFLSISGFFTHASWGFVCSSILKVGEVDKRAQPQVPS